MKPIDEAIKTHDENQKADKKKQLVAYFDSIIGDLAESVTFERVFDPKMVNASTSMKKAKEASLMVSSKSGRTSKPSTLSSVSRTAPLLLRITSRP